MVSHTSAKAIPLHQVQTQRLKNKKRQIGLIGGTFNPVHQAHLIMAEQVLSRLGLDAIWFLPDNIPPHKQKKSAIDANYRVEMLKLAIEDNDDFDLNLSEIYRGGVSYTLKTIKALQEQHQDIDFYFILGGDMIQDLPNWYKIEELLPLVTFVGVKRPGYEVASPYPVIWVDSPLLEISSTQIRKRCQNHESIRYLVPKKVMNYINEKGLYQDES
ncbi:nicotinate-nucleotide adenylyltransferase [Holzapfeliella floricola]|uniref:Probable nicotinate-nucleotide adenylyltransferase n=1 Tax=Holzapfeliella floricola DSM 23037 = JCM 16512 TaxID=1423744 RepID=A0A0R2DJP1_9LACO|nr:nicotinate-nucleotide adenylyltransferase [Holzapfeliella floricola]KRN03894.1 Nicotinate-nucleotide adenylyltransferase (Deamido-NAD(+) pyrophosphorylase) [Holzapfeliella floricola DSM 23037 = JCM 16512]